MHLNTVQKERYFSRCWLDNYPRLHLSELRSVLNLLCKVGGRPRRWLSPVFHLWPQTTLGSPGPSGTTQFNTSRHSPQKPLCAYAPSFFLYFFPSFFFLINYNPMLSLSISISLSRRSVPPDPWQKASILSDRAVGTYTVLKTVNVNLI